MRFMTIFETWDLDFRNRNIIIFRQPLLILLAEVTLLSWAEN